MCLYIFALRSVLGQVYACTYVRSVWSIYIWKFPWTGNIISNSNRSESVKIKCIFEWEMTLYWKEPPHLPPRSQTSSEHDLCVSYRIPGKIFKHLLAVGHRLAGLGAAVRTINLFTILQLTNSMRQLDIQWGKLGSKKFELLWPISILCRGLARKRILIWWK